MYVVSEKRYLQHYGTKGMQWGVRKKRKSSVNTRSDRFVLKKGTTISRVSTTKKESHKGKAYASFKKWDSIGYMARSMPFVKTFNMTMVLKENLVSPSKKERIDAFIDLAKKKDGVLLKTLSEAQHDMVKVKSAAAFEKRYKKMAEAQLRAKAYKDMAQNLAFNESLRKQYFKELKKRGFNMTIDDADAQVLANSPIVVFDRGKSLKVASVDRVTIKYLIDYMKKEV